jgi:hypothetical protein
MAWHEAALTERPIVAGTTGVIPAVPGAGPLFLFASIRALSWRRRRQSWLFVALSEV